MREILFRGKAVQGGKWLYGDVMDYGGKTQIWYLDGQEKWNALVDPSTVGQCIGGLTDKNGVKIFEGDIIRGEGGRAKTECFEIRWSAALCGFTAGEGRRVWPNLNQATVSEYEVIGNIHDNPELLEEATP